MGATRSSKLLSSHKCYWINYCDHKQGVGRAKRACIIIIITRSDARFALVVQTICPNKISRALVQCSQHMTDQSANEATRYSHCFYGSPPNGRITTERSPLLELPQAILPPESKAFWRLHAVTCKLLMFMQHVCTFCHLPLCACSQVDGKTFSVIACW